MSNSDNERDFSSIIEELKARGFEFQPERTIIKIPDASHVLWRGIKWYLDQQGKEFQNVVFTDSNGVVHHPYREVAEWLSDNKGQGLYLYGGCGLGKTMLARYIIPQILYHYANPRKITHCYTMTELNDPDKLREAMSKHIISIDDVGVEEQMVTFGQRRNVFDEIMDNVEKCGKLIIITSNLTGEDIDKRYGTRTLDRLLSNTRRIMFDLTDEDGNRKSLRTTT